jgi:hypothetical protein
MDSRCCHNSPIYKVFFLESEEISKGAVILTGSAQLLAITLLVIGIFALLGTWGNSIGLINKVGFGGAFIGAGILLTAGLWIGLYAYGKLKDRVDSSSSVSEESQSEEGSNSISEDETSQSAEEDLSIEGSDKKLIDSINKVSKGSDVIPCSLPPPTLPMSEDETSQSKEEDLSIGGSDKKLIDSINKVFKGSYVIQGADSADVIPIKKDLSLIHQVIQCSSPPSTLPSKTERGVRIERELSEIMGKRGLTHRHGLEWGRNVVLMRGFRLSPQQGMEQLGGELSDNMITLIQRTFMFGMQPNGYLLEGESLVYHDNLTFTDDQRHNWLVSTTCSLNVACRYATANTPGLAGVVFFVHAPQEAMKDELHGVNLSAVGLISPALEEIAFIQVPPKYIIGAVPVVCTAFSLRKQSANYRLLPKLFIPNPNFEKGKCQSDQLPHLGMEDGEYSDLQLGSSKTPIVNYEKYHHTTFYTESCKEQFKI